MAFGKNLNQNDENPSVNNYCGGYAMAAILNDRDDTDQWSPKAVYDSLLRQQTEVDEPLQNMLQTKKLNGTDIVLPSSLVLFAYANGFAVELLYAKSLPFPSVIIQAEKQRCPEGTVKELGNKEDVMRCFSDESVRYGLVLVSNHNHWVAVKRKSDNTRFSVYNPATGVCNKVNDGSELVEYLGSIDSDAGDLIITLK